MRLNTFIASMFFGISAFLLLPTISSHAQKANEVGGRLYKKTTTISFGEDSISGDLSKPDGEYFDARRKVKHKNLLKPRPHWKRKILRSVNEL